MLNNRQLRCIELMVDGDHTQKEIAEMLHVSQATICNWKKNDEFMDEYTSALRNSMKQFAAPAFRTMINLSLHSRNDNVRFMAARDILDRAGFKPDDSVKLSGNGMVVIVDDCGQ